MQAGNTERNPVGHALEEHWNCLGGHIVSLASRKPLICLDTDHIN